ncbi:MAG: RagB/SusD family nutrient uptake outer membrane protein, partial [Bacteroidales bacterium]|nr:RagB/SusD family nutrient uptake outer membrane protein [Bacteroidales bacterium]
MNLKNYILIFVCFSLFTACDKFLEPEMDNTLEESVVLDNPQYAEGLLLQAYRALPTAYNFNEDIISDDAATNAYSSNWRDMATGYWTAEANPVSTWSSAYSMIFYINTFLEKYEDVPWFFNGDGTEHALNALHLIRLKGEAYGLRAYYQMQLLKYHGGLANGQLLGFPIVTEVLSPDETIALTRDTYSDCVAQILSDCDIAITNLADVYGELEEEEYLQRLYPLKEIGKNGSTYHVIDTTKIPNDTIKIEEDSFADDLINYNTANSSKLGNRMNRLAAKMVKSRTLLYAASPAYAGSGVSVDSAANFMGKVIREYIDLGTFEGKDDNDEGTRFYMGEPVVDELDDFKENEAIWFSQYRGQNRTMEQNNFPPSLYGYGRVNPSQNLVDVFPMANGYPISDLVNSGYNDSLPYSGRDPRLNQYIACNGAQIIDDPKNMERFQFFEGTYDGMLEQLNSTKTGYYLRKFLNFEVSLDPDGASNAKHFYTYFRQTELL